MSESDSFIKEVSEEVRQDRMFRLWKRYAPFVIGAIVLVVGASAAWNWMKHREIVEARERGGAFIDAGGSAAKLEVLTGLEQGLAKTLAEMRLAAALGAEGDATGAAEIYRRVSTSDAPSAYRDLALLRAIQLEAARADPASLAVELESLVGEGAPYRPLALELRGVLRMNSGNPAGAREDLEAAIAAEDATLETRRRVSELLTSLAPLAAAPNVKPDASEPEKTEDQDESGTAGGPEQGGADLESDIEAASKPALETSGETGAEPDTGAATSTETSTETSPETAAGPNSAEDSGAGNETPTNSDTENGANQGTETGN